MIKLMIAGRRAPGQTRRGAQRHLRDIHAKMVLCPPPGAGAMPLDYVQNHVIDGVYPGTGRHAIERDLVTELWFESPDHLRASVNTPYYLANLKPDEPRFVDDATVAKMVVRPEPLRDGTRGRSKVFLFAADDAATAATFAAVPGLGTAVRNVVMPPPDGSPPFVGAVFEGWFDQPDDALGAIERLSESGSVLEQGFAVVAEEYDSNRLRAHHEPPTTGANLAIAPAF